MPYSTLIATDTLATHLNDPSWLIADCRYDLADENSGSAQYRAAHVPGAVFVSVAHDLAGGHTGRNGRHPLPTPEQIAGTFGRLGIGAETQVVAYDQDLGAYASRLWWMLKYLGHDAVAVLDGGWAKWVREQRPVRDGAEACPSATFTARVRHQMRADVQDVERLLGDPAMLLVDARSAQRFEGQPDPLDTVSGHIPGARNRPYRDNIADDGTMRPADALRSDFERVLDGRSAHQTVMYCGSGITACHNLLAMEHAGLRGARLFAGSWSEWGSDPARPVEKGAAGKG